MLSGNERKELAKRRTVLLKELRAINEKLAEKGSGGRKPSNTPTQGSRVETIFKYIETKQDCTIVDIQQHTGIPLQYCGSVLYMLTKRGLLKRYKALGDTQREVWHYNIQG